MMNFLTDIVRISLRECLHQRITIPNIRKISCAAEVDRDLDYRDSYIRTAAASALHQRSEVNRTRNC